MKMQRKDVVQEGKSTRQTGKSSQEKKKFTGKCNYGKKVGHKEKNCWFKKQNKHKANQYDKGKNVVAFCVQVLTLSSIPTLSTVIESSQKDY